jgi:hypothetical protein
MAHCHSTSYHEQSSEAVAGRFCECDACRSSEVRDAAIEMRSCVRACVRVSFQDPYSIWVVWVSAAYTDNHQVVGGSSQDLHCKIEYREER